MKIVLYLLKTCNDISKRKSAAKLLTGAHTSMLYCIQYK